jgi:hypothetical protein
MSSRTIKKLLLSLIVVGILMSFTVGGTFAVLNGRTDNPNQSIASGSMLMDNTVGAAAACHSTSGVSNINTGCTTLFTSGLLYPILSTTPASTEYASANVTIANVGTLASWLKVYMPNCDASQTTGSPAAGGTNPCCPGLPSGLPASPNACPTGSLDFFIQEYTSSAFTTKTSTCAYPASTSASCSFTNDTLGTFFGLYHDNTDYFTIGTSKMAAGTTRYFQVVVAEPINAANTLQGETATFSLYWHFE